MKRVTKIFVITLALVSWLSAINCFGQAKKPKLMIVPSLAWCTQNGYVTTFNNQGVTERIPDYSKALAENMDLSSVIAQIGQLMADKGFPLTDLQQTLTSINNTNAENSLIRSKTSGAAIAENPIDRLRRVAKSDIIMELQWDVITTGPKKQIRYTLKGLDAYSNKQIATATGIGQASFSAAVPVLLQEAVADKMDPFCNQLQDHFNDMLQNGREVVININIFDNGSGLDLEKEYNGKELLDIIDDWFNENTVNHRYSRGDNTENAVTFDQVRIPLYDMNGKAIDTRAFAMKLSRFLKAAPYNITCKVNNKGLGRCQLILGEK